MIFAGSGTIRYQASNDLVAAAAAPNCAASPTRFTVEIANTIYGAMQPPTPALQQSFRIAFTADG
jgi:hypothetical protein